MKNTDIFCTDKSFYYFVKKGLMRKLHVSYVSCVVNRYYFVLGNKLNLHDWKTKIITYPGKIFPPNIVTKYFSIIHSKVNMIMSSFHTIWWFVEYNFMINPQLNIRFQKRLLISLDSICIIIYIDLDN